MDGTDNLALGDLGESEFKRLAQLAGFEVSKPEPDRLGIDFILTDPAAPYDAASPYDLRGVRRSCLVQVKSTIRPIKAVSISLSVGEHLAKDSRPCFVIMVGFNADKSVRDMYLIHILDHHLSPILRRLRIEQVKQNPSINRTKLSITLKAKDRISPSAPNLHARLMTDIGPSMEAYAKRKGAQVETLGFDESHPRYSGIIHLAASSADIVDMELGLRPIVPHRLTVFEHRFGIKLPAPALQEAAMWKIEVQPTGRASLTVTSEPLAPSPKEPSSITLHGECYLPGAHVPVEHLRVRFVSALVEVVIANNNWAFRTREASAWEIARRPAEFADHYRAYAIAHNGRVRIKAVVDDGRTFETVGNIKEVRGGEAGNFGTVVTLMERLEKLEAAAKAEVPLTLAQFADQQRDLSMLYTIIHRKDDDAWLGFEGSELPETAASDQAVYSSAVPFGTGWLSFTFRMSLRRERGHTWSGTFGKLLSLRYLKSLEDYADHLDLVHGASDSSTRVFQDPGSFSRGNVNIEVV